MKFDKKFSMDEILNAKKKADKNHSNWEGLKLNFKHPVLNQYKANLLLDDFILCRRDNAPARVKVSVDYWMYYNDENTMYSNHSGKALVNCCANSKCFKDTIPFIKSELPSKTYSILEKNQKDIEVNFDAFLKRKGRGETKSRNRLYSEENKGNLNIRTTVNNRRCKICREQYSFWSIRVANPAQKKPNDWYYRSHFTYYLCSEECLDKFPAYFNAKILMDSVKGSDDD